MFFLRLSREGVNWRPSAAGLALVLLLAGCGYRHAVTDVRRLPAHQPLWVAFIGNETISPTAQTVIRRALLTAAHAQRDAYPAASEDEARIIVTGNLKGYTTTAISYSAVDRVREYRLKIEAELELRLKGDAAPLWKGVIQSYQDFPASEDLALQRNAEEAALAAASQTLSQRFLSAVEQSY